jgi:hypothetical protein
VDCRDGGELLPMHSNVAVSPLTQPGAHVDALLSSKIDASVY